MQIKILTITLIVLFAFVTGTKAQENSLTGKLTTFNTFPVKGVHVFIKKTGAKATTDSLGNFTILCEPKCKLIVKADGFINQSIKVKNLNDTLKIDLRLMASKKAEEIAIGAGYIRKEDITYARNHLGFENPASKYNDIFDMINGKIPGVEIIDNREIRIRGEQSLQGSNAALIVIDDVISDMGVLTSIPINDIRSIDVLKGPDATLYGARGANGVFLVTTKSATN